jgi:hypothetical protein
MAIVWPVVTRQAPFVLLSDDRPLPAVQETVAESERQSGIRPEPTPASWSTPSAVHASPDVGPAANLERQVLAARTAEADPNPKFESRSSPLQSCRSRWSEGQNLGASCGPCRGWEKDSANSQTVSPTDRSGLTQAKRPPRTPVRLRSCYVTGMLYAARYRFGALKRTHTGLFSVPLPRSSVYCAAPYANHNPEIPRRLPRGCKGRIP